MLTSPFLRSPLIRSSRYFLLSLLALMISACGFHLKGQMPIPQALSQMTRTSLSGMSDFDQALKHKLAQANVTLLSESTKVDESIYELKVLNITTTDKTLAKASNNDVTQLERKIKTSYFIRDNSGKSLYGPRSAQVTRTLTNQDASDDVVLAYNQEQMEEMVQELAAEIVSDLAYAPL